MDKLLSDSAKTEIFNKVMDILSADPSEDK